MSKDIEQFDIAIVGGGIVGAGLFREQCLHGLKPVIIDQSDFNAQTSQGSSKMLHGGIRYLENLDFALVFEALFEKNLWIKKAPHITKEVPFYLPVYKSSKWPLFFMRIGLFIYDLLSLFKNTPHKVLNIENTKRVLKGINTDGLTGCGMYFDGIVDDAKLGLECIYDGLTIQTQAKALNYKKVIKIESSTDEHKITLKDSLNGEEKVICAKKVIIATGPFTDQTMKELAIPWKPIILPSKGVHLWLKKDALPLEDAMVLQTKDNRVIFLIPQRNAILVGTTETPLDPDENFKDIKANQEEIDYLLQEVNQYFPKAFVNETQIINTIAAVRPLVKDGHSSAKVSRKHKIFTPKPGLYVIAGGKYTTFRKMAQDLNKKIFKELNIKLQKDLTLTPLKKTSVIEDPFAQKISKENIDQIIKHEMVKTKDDLITRRLSLPTLSHLNDEEIENKINDLKL